jgi:hypothetical protein
MDMPGCPMSAKAQGLPRVHSRVIRGCRDGDYMFREILLTREYEAALFFLGYDPERFREGFENLEDIFKYVAGSRYFNRDIFLLENRNAQSRIRDRKRPTYTKFLTWCEDRPNLPGREVDLAGAPRRALPCFSGSLRKGHSRPRAAARGQGQVQW